MQKYQIQIREIYKKLGKEYLNNIKDLEPAEMKKFIKLIPRGGLILDVGCAGGKDSNKFIKADFKVIGIDLVDEFIKIAKKNVSKGKFKVMDLVDINFPRNYFDGIWAVAVLLHIEKKDILKTLKSLYSILKPGGFINIRVKRGGDPKSYLDEWSKNTNRNFTFFFKSELEKYIKTAGFKIVRSTTVLDEAKRKNVKWISVIATK